MAMTPCLPFYPFAPVGYNAGSQNTFVLNTTDDWLAFIFYWPGGNLTKAAFMCAAATASPVLTVQIFDVDPSDGGTTPVNTASPQGSAVDTVALAANTGFSVVGIGASPLAAGFYAIRLIFKSGTSVSVISSYNLGGSRGTTNHPSIVTVTNGGAQTRVVANGIAVAVGDSVYVPIAGVSPPALISVLTFADTSNPDEYILWFANPYPFSIRICGFEFLNRASTTPNMRGAYYTGTLSAGIVTGPTQQTTVTIDRDLVGNNVSSGFIMVNFPTKQTLAVGASCGIGVRAATTNNMTLNYWDWTSGNEAVMDAWMGQSSTLLSRENDAGDLTQVHTYQTPLIFPIADGVDIGSSVGSVPLSRPTIFWE